MADTKKSVRAALAEWRDFRGCTPLGSVSSGHAIDRCNGFLSNARSILATLAAAHEDAATLLAKGESSEFDNRNGAIMAGALEGVEDLISFACFLLED